MWSPEHYPYDGLMWAMDEVLTFTELPEGTEVFRPVDVGPYVVNSQGGLAVDVWEVGFGHVFVEEGAFCLWMGTWLAVRGVDSEQEAKALAEMQHFLTTYTFLNTYDPHSAQPNTRDRVERAALGDPSGVMRDWELNCSHYHDQIKTG